MRIKEILQEVSRRDLLKGMLGAGALAVTPTSQAGAGQPHVGYEFQDSEIGKAWSRLDPKIKEIWLKRQKALQARSIKVLNKILSVMPEDQQKLVAGVKVYVPITYSLADIAHVGADKIIEVDLGTFWDLSDSTLAYTIAHELGHIYFNAIKKYRFGDSWETPAKKRRKVQEELDCDEYGARLAYTAGFNPIDAGKEFTEESKKERYDPNVKGRNYYPDYQMRKSVRDKAIDQIRQQQKQQETPPKIEEPPKVEPLQDELPKDEKTSAVQREMFRHILRGINAMMA